MANNWLFDGRSTADDVLSGKDLSAKTIIVTGANTGIGFETARALAAAGGHIILAGRNRVTNEEAISKITALHSNANVEFASLDLASLESVRAFCENLLAETIDVLICNAGVTTPDYQETQDGFEQTVGICHIGHFLLTQLLLPKLLATPDPRVVMLSSESHRYPKVIDFNKLPLPKETYKGLSAYGQAKLCNTLFANELQRRYSDQGLTACSLHPGTFVTTDIGRNSMLGRVFMKLASPFTKSPAQGAATSVFCATHEPAADLGGLYFSDCQPKRNSKEASDEEVAKKLWNLSEEWVAAAQ
jgi:WW domain-containing oxidoreductase